jgi:hypothetical protein
MQIKVITYTLNRSFESVEEFSYFGTRTTNQGLIRGELMDSLKWSNV